MVNDMNDDYLPMIKKWEALKARSEAVCLSLTVDGSRILVEENKTKVVYFQARDLHELEIYIKGYEQGLGHS